jgi:VCBS repeat-containing protein
MDGHDIMDGMIGDHNPYTKFLYGWLKNSRLVVAEDTVTLTLEDFTKNGDSIIIANNWDEKLGVYQEFYVLMYYRNTGLNGGDYGYFDQNGIVVYHVNSSLYVETENGENYYYIYNTNTDASDEENGTEDNLVEFVLSTDGNYVYLAGDTISAGTTDDNGDKIAYTFTVNSLTSTTATITFKKNR